MLQIGDRAADVDVPGSGWWVRVDDAGVTANIDAPSPGFLAWEDCGAVRFQPVPVQPPGATGTVWYLEFVARRPGAVRRLSAQPDLVSARMLTDLGVVSGEESLVLPVLAHVVDRVPEVLEHVRRHHPDIEVDGEGAPRSGVAAPAAPQHAASRGDVPPLTITQAPDVAALRRTRMLSWAMVAVWGVAVLTVGVPGALSTTASTGDLVLSIALVVLGVPLTYRFWRSAQRAGRFLRERQTARLELTADGVRVSRGGVGASTVVRLPWSHCAAVEVGAVPMVTPSGPSAKPSPRYLRFVPDDEASIDLLGEVPTDLLIGGRTVGAEGPAAALVWWWVGTHNTDALDVLDHVARYAPEVRVVRTGA